MDKLQAYDRFWQSFGIPAYDQYSVPDMVFDSNLNRMVENEPPYITYQAATDDFNHPVALTASIWYRDRSWAAITAKEKQISEYIGRGGVCIPYDEGGFWLVKGSPWAQRMDDPADDMIRRIVLQVNVEFID